MTIAALLKHLRARFSESQVAQPETDARELVGGILGMGLTDIVLHGDRLVEDAHVERLLAAAERRCLGEPVHRILGHRWFFGIDLNLVPETLEPRPDTETLVEGALPIVREIVAKRGVCNLLDLGTGSGAISLAILSQVEEAVAVATDISDHALQAARENALRNGLQRRFSTCRSDWFEAVDGRFDLIVSNPPYIRTADIATLDREVRDHDPLRALDGGADGLDAYRAIAGSVAQHLEADGAILLETGCDQHAEVIALFRRAGFAFHSRIRDLGGNDRVVVLTPAAKGF